MNAELEKIWKEPAVRAWRNYGDVCLEEVKKIRSHDLWCPSRNTNPRPLDSEAGVGCAVAERLHSSSLGLGHPVAVVSEVMSPR
jgi:hypothetical protein